MPAAVLTIDINARLANLEQAMAKIPGTIGQGTRAIDAQLNGLNTKLATFGRTMVGAFGVPLGAAAILGVLRSIGQATADEERALAKLNATLIATKSSAGLTADQLGKLGDEISGSTIFDDDEVRKAETALLRFRNVQGDVFKDALRLAPDVASTLGTDLTSAAQSLGRALTDPASGMRALKAAGVELSEQQTDLAARFIESGDKASAQRIVLDELRKSVGGTSAAENVGLTGATKSLGKAWDDLGKTFGREVTGVASSSISRLAAIIKGAADGLDMMREIANTPSGPLPVFGAATPEQLEAEAGARAQRIQQRMDAAYSEQQSQLQRQGQLEAAASQSKLIVLRRDLDTESALYASAYSRNEVTITSFYDRQRAAIDATYKATVDGIDKQYEALGKLRALPSTDQKKRADIDVQLAGLGVQGNQAVAAKQLARVQADVQETAAVRALTDSYKDLGIELAELRGDDVEAARLSFARANELRAARFTIEAAKGTPGASEALAELNNAEQLTKVRTQLNVAFKDYGIIQDGLAAQQERITIAEQSGALTTVQAMERRSSLALLYKGVLEDQLTTLEKLRREREAQGADTTDEAAKINALRIQVEQLAASTDLLAQSFNKMGQDSLSGLLQGLANNPKDWKNVILQSFNGLTSQLNKVAADELSQRLFGKDGALSGFGGFFSKIFGGDKGAGGTAVVQSQILALGTTSTTTSAALASVASAAQSAAVALASMGGGGAMKIPGFDFGGSGFGGPDPGFISESPYTGPGFGTYASGTNSARGGMSRVGEFGKELMYVPPRSTIVPNHRIGNGGGRSTSVQQTVNVNVLPGANRQTSLQAAKRAGDAVRSRVLRFGN